jgi:histidinol phosphatase-like enzyme
MHRIDLQRSWLIADVLDDIEAGRRVGCRTALLDVGHEVEWRISPLRRPDHRCSDLREAAQVIGKLARQETAARAHRGARQ